MEATPIVTGHHEGKNRYRYEEYRINHAHQISGDHIMDKDNCLWSNEWHERKQLFNRTQLKV